MCDWKNFSLGDVCKFIDYRGKTPPKVKSGVPLVTAKIIKNGFIQEPQEFIAEEFYSEWMRRGIPKKGDIVFTTEAPLGEVAQIKTDKKLAFAQRVIILESNNELLCSSYLFYALQDTKLKSRIEARQSGTTVSGIKAAELKKVEINLPPLETQKKIAAVLSALDDKIELNNAINKNLEEQAQAIFKKMFVEDFNPAWQKCRADEVFSISIGKTPPRKEKQWFTQNANEVTWVSISDMGSCGVYIGQSSEYLTAEAIQKFNVKPVPPNTVILSFKLTVGRVAITDKELTTNEAIAHFVTDNFTITEYLYLYLKNFNYQSLGSTSSIATAVNSKIIKAMPFIVPEEKELYSFHSLVEPLFSMIGANTQENQKLAEIRDALLPRLMSGKIDVSNVKI